MVAIGYLCGMRYQNERIDTAISISLCLHQCSSIIFMKTTRFHILLFLPSTASFSHSKINFKFSYNHRIHLALSVASIDPNTNFFGMHGAPYRKQQRADGLRLSATDGKVRKLTLH